MGDAIVLGGSHSVRDSRLEGAVVALIKEWAIAHPDELVALDFKVKAIRADGGDRTSDGGNMRHKASIPASLYFKMENEIQKNWMADSRLRDIFFSNFTIGLVNRHGRVQA